MNHFKYVQQAKLGLFLALCLSFSVTHAAKSVKDSVPVDPVSAEKARVYLGVARKPLTEKWLYDWDVRKLKTQLFGNQNRYYAFNVLKKDGDQLLPFAKFSNKRNKYPHGHYYFDVEPQELELAIFALNTRNFNTIQGLPGLIKLNLEAGKTYFLGYGAGGLEGRLIPVNQIVDVTLEPKLFDFCNKLRGQAIDRKERKQLTKDFQALGSSNYAEQLACDIAMAAQPYEMGKSFDKMSNWAAKKQDKLQNFILKREKHDQK